MFFFDETDFEIFSGIRGKSLSARIRTPQTSPGLLDGSLRYLDTSQPCVCTSRVAYAAQESDRDNSVMRCTAKSMATMYFHRFDSNKVSENYTVKGDKIRNNENLCRNKPITEHTHNQKSV